MSTSRRISKDAYQGGAVKRKKWVRPAKTWSTNELVNLQIPVDPKRREQFAKSYLQKTGYAFDGTMLLEHALKLITGAFRSGKALETAVRYLMFGIPTFPHRNEAALQEVRACDESKFVTRRFSIDEAIQYLAQFENGLNAWQFVQLANSLAAAKAAIRRQVSAKNLERTKEGETKIA
jgi:hypothetical protein